ncbi:MAG: hypothetical protein QMD46_13030 [Methanomicrobiales archaeon]|nr:hypothetical protein [Methanomicrobiales archaeon]
MTVVTVDLPQDVWSEIQALVAEGIFRDPEQAIVSLVRRGLTMQRGAERPGIPPAPLPPMPPPGRPPGRWPEHLE